MTRDEKKLLHRLGGVITMEREDLGLTLPKLATLARVSKGNLSRIERGGDFQISTFYRLCWALNVEPCQMVLQHVPPFRRKKK